MQRKHGPWTIEDSIRRYRNEYLEVWEDRVIRPDGSPGAYATIKLKPGVCTLAVDEEGGVYLTRQFRYGIGRESVEAASGGLGEGEPPLEAAKRELKEELGIQAGEWVALGAVDVDPAKMDSRTHLFLAKGLTFSRTEREPTEDISTVKISLREAADQVMAGEITHASSCVLILKAQRLLSTDQPPDGQSGGEEAPGGLIGCDERCDPGDFDGRRAVLSDGTGYPPRI